MTDERELREHPVVSLNKKREFTAHMLAYALVNVFIVVIWAVTGTGNFFWPVFPIFGWGIGIVFHAWDVYSRGPGEERIRREMEQMRERATRAARLR